MTESEILPPSEEPESSSIEDSESSRELDEATHDPGAHIEKIGDTKTAEAIEASISDLTYIPDDGIPKMPLPAPAQIFPIFKNGDPIVPEWGNAVVTKHHNHKGGTSGVRIPGDKQTYEAVFSGADITQSPDKPVDEISQEESMTDASQATPIQEVRPDEETKADSSRETLKEDKGDDDVMVDPSQLKPKEDDDDDEE